MATCTGFFPNGRVQVTSLEPNCPTKWVIAADQVSYISDAASRVITLSIRLTPEVPMPRPEHLFAVEEELAKELEEAGIVLTNTDVTMDTRIKKEPVGTEVKPSSSLTEPSVEDDHINHIDKRKLEELIDAAVAAEQKIAEDKRVSRESGTRKKRLRKTLKRSGEKSKATSRSTPMRSSSTSGALITTRLAQGRSNIKIEQKTMKMSAEEMEERRVRNEKRRLWQQTREERRRKEETPEQRDARIAEMRRKNTERMQRWRRAQREAE